MGLVGEAGFRRNPREWQIGRAEELRCLSKPMAAHIPPQGAAKVIAETPDQVHPVYSGGERERPGGGRVAPLIGQTVTALQQPWRWWPRRAAQLAPGYLGEDLEDQVLSGTPLVEGG